MPWLTALAYMPLPGHLALLWRAGLFWQLKYNQKEHWSLFICLFICMCFVSQEGYGGDCAEPQRELSGGGEGSWSSQETVPGCLWWAGWKEREEGRAGRARKRRTFMRSIATHRRKERWSTSRYEWVAEGGWLVGEREKNMGWNRGWEGVLGSWVSGPHMCGQEAVESLDTIQIFHISFLCL